VSSVVASADVKGVSGKALKAFVAHGPCSIGSWAIQLADLTSEINKYVDFGTVFDEVKSGLTSEQGVRGEVKWSW
jgi:hypothetical protein